MSLSPEPAPADQPAAPEYPKHLERAVTLGDGTTIFIRPIRPEDAPRLIELYGRLSERSVYQRFFTLRKQLPPDWARYFATVDYRGRMALIAEGEGPGGVELIGVGRYEADGEEPPEIALLVVDGWQGRGVGTVLLESVLDAGRRRGFRRFRAFVLADNRAMLALLARATEIKQRKTEQGIVTIVLEPRAAGGNEGR